MTIATQPIFVDEVGHVFIWKQDGKIHFHLQTIKEHYKENIFLEAILAALESDITML